MNVVHIVYSNADPLPLHKKRSSTRLVSYKATQYLVKCWRLLRVRLWIIQYAQRIKSKDAFHNYLNMSYEKGKI